MAVQHDGKIILAGSEFDADINGYNSILARYTATGTLDKTFNGSGEEDYSTSSAALLRYRRSPGGMPAIAVQTDG